jgi:mRNA interferase HigB
MDARRIRLVDVIRYLGICRVAVSHRDLAGHQHRVQQAHRPAARIGNFQLGMHNITRKRLNDFADRHPEVRSALAHWYREMKRWNFASLAEVRAIFPSADQVGKLTVFNIAGNRVRLIVAIHYNRQRVYIRAVLTHREYDEGKWKE